MTDSRSMSPLSSGVAISLALNVVGLTFSAGVLYQRLLSAESRLTALERRRDHTEDALARIQEALGRIDERLKLLTERVKGDVSK